MTRSTQLTPAVGGQTKDRARAGAEDNGGILRWALVAAGGGRLVQSATFASSKQAKQAARVVRSGAVSVPFENRAADPAPLELAARRETATVTDELDAERWLDEGGSFRSEAVTRCPARR